MITAKLLIYGDMENEASLTDFHFDINQVQGVFIGRNGFISTVISGQIYELKYNQKLFERIKKVLEQGKIFLN